MMATTKEPGSKTKRIEEMSSDTPYDVFRGAEIWNVVDKAISDLVKNNDLIENTRRDYIVGYICQKLQELKEKS